MKNVVRRLFVEKKRGFDVEAQHLLKNIKDNLGIKELEYIRVINRYDISGVSIEEFERSKRTIFSEPNVDNVYDEVLEINDDEKVLAIEFLPGQYDQRADSAAECIQILAQKEKPIVHVAKLLILKGSIDNEDFDKIKNYCINPVDSREASLEKPDSLEMKVEDPEEVKILEGFIDKSEDEIAVFREELGFAMNIDDLLFCRDYFRDTEKRNPTITELKVIDTYWSDHCRHTTFLTEIEEAEIEKGLYGDVIEEAYNEYLKSREYVYRDKKKDICLMDIAVMAMKELRKKGKLDDLEVSDEINACSIEVDVDVNGKNEKWLVMFKNETHNHPTEIEPFGGAATCLGGAIRDPLSGRAYVYQAMRVTGSGDPRARIEDTLPGKLPQRKITIEAAAGYSSYGNQIGLATGQVAEIYDEGFLAKRMEIGAVIAAVPKENVRREKAVEGDLILLVGGRTGRDGCGGATGSSKEHTEESIFTCGAEVQKGNPPTERKIQRLFRRPELTKLIKKCNDFGAGGVSVAIGELADSLEIDLDKVPKKYEGLDGTELAISESQERMAVVIDKNDLDKFKEIAKEENLEVALVARVTDTGRLIMKWRGESILDISRDFLNTNGVKQRTKAKVIEPSKKDNYFDSTASEYKGKEIKAAWIENLKDLNVADQKGLVERFDSTIGAGTVLMPFGGKYSLTPTEGMVAKIPVLDGETNTCTIMTYGYNPRLAKWSPFHGAVYAVIESISKVVALGGNYKGIRLTLQEYFEKLGDDKEKWGKPFSALLGAFYVQKKLMIPAIGGKDSMSGTFKDLNVPPTLVSFAVDIADARAIVSPEFKRENSYVVLIPLKKDERNIPNFDKLDKNYSKIYELIQDKKILAADAVRIGGIAATVSKMAFGNKIGLKFLDQMEAQQLFKADYGSMILEIDSKEDLDKLLSGIEYKILGRTQEKRAIDINGVTIDLDEAIIAFREPLKDIFPIKEDAEGEPETIAYEKGSIKKSSVKIAKPRILIPVFPGTNCEYDTARAFERAGGIAETMVFRNLTPRDIEKSIEEIVQKIDNSQIIALPGGFSAGDEPDGSGKFIATVFRNPRVKEAVMKLMKHRDGLMLGICNGFQALIKLGLLPYGEIRDIDESCPTLTFNRIGRHVSCMPMTKVVSNLSPWFNNVKVGDVHRIAMSHGEGRFVARDDVMKKLIKNGQIATQYVDFSGNPSYDGEFNPNGSFNAVEGITSPDGRILGKMGHSERLGKDICKNIPGNKDQKLFEAGIGYFG
ncbi:phosphoribosylformylglycinamidine synthase [Paramaledivibacter caminithermalis]|jgi:phosphoribosylformylglycinamidine synthase|uniref:Phosphoribosylformylglycinamidine synthase n=1 Tax=Paramaledivibacter caminithermalis (strain DSM 15212 / CIP 107654 / DViRD3) TaxID=1121301 RepID=A0A1M6QJN1_PARC5|nr:phosphoribosylformylglycinamidine synthase [Paramaledivibacter caminithermalis]SHK20378.1 phosphoribosylformylglycinamidine synthase [Paramaledivibacter caminithermalis DSM 15212]